MSVSGEFQRHLSATLALVGEAEHKCEGEALASLSALRDGLDSARFEKESPLADRAKRVLDSLEHHWFDMRPAEARTNLADVLPGIRASAEDLDRIARIVLGRAARETDRNTTPQP